MYDHKIDDDLDYETMYKALSKKKYGIRDQLNAVMVSSCLLEIGVNQTVDVVTKKLESQILANWNKRPFLPISSKIIALRFANIIGEDLFHNMSILFKIRNKFAHGIFFSLDECNGVFAQLGQARIQNTFLAQLPHDVVKFQLLVSSCSVNLLKISQKVDPNSVLDIEATEETVFKENPDW